MAGRVRIVYLTSKVSESERGQYPSLPVQVPLELVGHRHDGDGHDDPVRGVYEIRGRAEGHDARRARQHPKFRHDADAVWATIESIPIQRSSMVIASPRSGPFPADRASSLTTDAERVCPRLAEKNERERERQRSDGYVSARAEHGDPNLRTVTECALRRRAVRAQRRNVRDRRDRTRAAVPHR